MGLNRLLPGDKGYDKAVDRSYRNAGVDKNEKDKSSPNYTGIDRDVTKTGMDPFSQEAFRENQSFKNTLGYPSELFDDQINSIRQQEHDYHLQQATEHLKEAMKLPNTPTSSSTNTSFYFPQGAVQGLNRLSNIGGTNEFK